MKNSTLSLEDDLTIAHGHFFTIRFSIYLLGSIPIQTFTYFGHMPCLPRHFPTKTFSYPDLCLPQTLTFKDIPPWRRGGDWLLSNGGGNRHVICENKLEVTQRSKKRE